MSGGTSGSADARRTVPPALRLQQDRADRQPVRRRALEPLTDVGDRREHHLHVRMGEPGVGTDEPVRLGDVGRQHPGAAQQVPGDLGRTPRVEQGAAGRADDQSGHQVILQVPADGRPGHQQRDAARGELVGVADPGEQQQLGRVHRATAEQDLAARRHGPHPPVAGRAFDRGRPPAVEQDAAGPYPGAHGEIRAAPDRPEVAVRRAESHPAALGDDGRAEPGGSRPVGRLDREPGLGRRRQEIGGVRVRAALRFPVQHPLGPTQRREHRRPGPQRPGLAGPAVVIGGESADPHHRVERRRPAQGPAPGPEDPAAGQFRLRHGLVAPVVAAPEQGGEGRRDPDRRVPVGRPRLEQQHPAARVGREPVGQHHPGRAGADDHVVEGHGCGFQRWVAGICRRNVAVELGP